MYIAVLGPLKGIQKNRDSSNHNTKTTYLDIPIAKGIYRLRYRLIFRGYLRGSAVSKLAPFYITVLGCDCIVCPCRKLPESPPEDLLSSMTHHYSYPDR